MDQLTRLKREGKIEALTDDLLTVLEGHMEVMETETLFYSCMAFLAISLCTTTNNRELSLKVMRMAIEDGIKMSLEREKLCKQI